MYLKELRLKNNLSVKELSSITGISDCTLWRYENGKSQIKNASVNILATLASVLNCRISDLLEVEPLPRCKTNYFFLCADGEKLSFVDAADLPSAVLKCCEMLNAIPIDDHTIKTSLIKYEIQPLTQPEKLQFFRTLKYRDVSDLEAILGKYGKCITMYENGRLDIRKAKAIKIYEVAKKLDVSIEDLIE